MSNLYRSCRGLTSTDRQTDKSQPPLLTTPIHKEGFDGGVGDRDIELHHFAAEALGFVEVVSLNGEVKWIEELAKAKILTKVRSFLSYNDRFFTAPP